MSQPPRFRNLDRNMFPDAPGWTDNLFTVLNETLQQVASSLANGISRADNLQASQQLGIAFTTGSPVANPVVVIKNKLPGGVAPRHVHIGQIYRRDGKQMANAVSLSWVMTGNGLIALSILGLETSTQYFLSVNYE